jgi:arsenate reductase
MESKTKYKVLFLCTGNQARSQIAEALLRVRGGSAFEVDSAGSRPKSAVHALTVAVLAEKGIDVSSAVPKNITRFVGERFDYVITLCDDARDECPVFPGEATRIHWSIPDPSAAEGSEGTMLEAFRAARDEIDQRIERFVSSVADQS